MYTHSYREPVSCRTRVSCVLFKICRYRRLISLPCCVSATEVARNKSDLKPSTPVYAYPEEKQPSHVIH